MKWKSWVGDCRQNVPEGEQRAEMKKWWHSYSTPPPCSGETEPRPQGWEKGREALWIPSVLQWLWRKHKICGGNVELGQLLLLAYCSEGQYQNISVFLNVNRKRMSWYCGPDSTKSPEIFITTFSDKEHSTAAHLTFYFNSTYFISIL